MKTQIVAGKNQNPSGFNVLANTDGNPCDVQACCITARSVADMDVRSNRSSR